MKRHTIVFTRNEGLKGVTDMAILVLEAAPVHTLETVQEMFLEACTRWLNRSAAGVEAWERSSQDFNIGDFVAEGLENRPGFTEVCRELGIGIYYANTLGADNHWSYDKVLNLRPEGG